MSYKKYASKMKSFSVFFPQYWGICWIPLLEKTLPTAYAKAAYLKAWNLNAEGWPYLFAESL